MRLAADKGRCRRGQPVCQSPAVRAQEDYGTYPRNFEQDCQLAAREGADIVFAPTAAEMYPAGFQTRFRWQNITRHLCGASRPGHFDGVATVLVKLFHVTGADCAVFGEKDYQQLAVIRRMIADLNMDIEIIGHPIVREEDGLAMSSRNAYLDEAERETALCLYRSMVMAGSMPPPASWMQPGCNSMSGNIFFPAPARKLIISVLLTA